MGRELLQLDEQEEVFAGVALSDQTLGSTVQEYEGDCHELGRTERHLEFPGEVDTFEVKSLFVGLDSQRWLSFLLEDLLLKIEPARRDSPHVTRTIT